MKRDLIIYWAIILVLFSINILQLFVIQYLALTQIDFVVTTPKHIIDYREIMRKPAMAKLTLKDERYLRRWVDGELLTFRESELRERDR